MTCKLIQIKEVAKLEKVAYLLKKDEAVIRRHGYGLEVGLNCLFLQFFYDFKSFSIDL